MSNIKFKGRAARGRASTARRALWLFVVLSVLLLVAYFTVTSSAFLKRFVLPRLGTSLHAELTADSIRLSPFTKLELTGFKLTPQGEETLLTGGRLRARYSLIAFLQGRTEVDELLLDAAIIPRVEKPDGSSNLRPLLSAGDQKPASKPSSGAPLQLNVKSVQLTNITVRHIQQRAGASPEVFQISQFHLAAKDIGNGGNGRIDFDGQLSLEQSATSGAAAGKLGARLRGGFAFGLDTFLKPTTLQGDGSFAVQLAQGPFADLVGVAATLTADATPTQIKEFGMAFTQAGARVGGLRVSGPFDAARREGKLALEVSGIDRRVLNLIGAGTGFDFGATTINTTTMIPTPCAIRSA